ncbi:MAG: dethiobiotin synthase [Planctomycetia bacterium]|nr:dethiobiotin synthase [Planctomycetia bacterium]
MRGLFITGTDTGVGKTRIACVIARTWRAERRNFRVMKPTATGDGEDTRALSAAAGDPEYTSITPFTFKAPAAPPVAARLEGKELSLAEIIESINRRADGAEAMLIEGVGGLLCPLTETQTVADLIVALGFPAVVVARRALGTLNHTLLTLEVARNRGLNICGVIVSETNPPVEIADQTNVAELQKRCRVLGVMPFGAETLEINWWSLIGGNVK